MGSIKVLDRFISKLEELAQLGDEAKRFEDLVARHEARALRELLKKLVPLMPYMDRPIATREVWVQGAAQDPEPTHHYKEPGIVLVNNFESTVRDAAGQMRHSGYKVIFTRGGKLVQLDRTGSWNEDQKNAFWSCEAHEIDLDAGFAERHMQECVASIALALERAIERQRGRRDTLRARLTVLRAIQRLLEGEDAEPEEPPSQPAGSPD